MQAQKRVAAIHDISGFGKCSLTVALPILSAAGIETSVLPTAVLSTHTGGFTGFTFRDLTADLKPIAAHWKSIGIGFDCLYSGFLGSMGQLDIVSEIFEMFKEKDTLILVDPAMADNGRLYSTFSTDFVKGMAAFCAKADIIVPNMTEAAFLLGESYQPGPYVKQIVESMLKNLSAMGPSRVVLTGVWFGDNRLGAAVFDHGEISYAFHNKIEGLYHGTGDVFASALLGALLNGFSLTHSAQIAVDFTAGSIQRTLEAGTDVRFGVKFELELPGYMKALRLL
ncbi:MAG: pyridoxamine kinase [Eubacteriales bacterium]